MTAKLEEILTVIEASGESAGVTVADHLRTVAANGREYASKTALREEAESLRAWADIFLEKTKGVKR